MNNCYDGQDTVVLVVPQSATDTNITGEVVDISALTGKGLIAVNLGGITTGEEVTLQLYEGDTNVPATLVETLASSLDEDGVYEYDIEPDARKKYIQMVPQVTGTVVVSATLTSPLKYV
jgi:hypothetical protein